MLFVSVPRLELMDSALQMSSAIELRLDLFTDIDIGVIKEFLIQAKEPVMLTLRKASHGGKFRGSEEERETLIEQLLDLKPSFFDLEYDMRQEFLEKILQRYIHTQFVISYHNVQGIPEDLETIYLRMKRYRAFSYKIALKVLSTNEALKMLLFARSHPRTSMICMGERGSFARVLGPIFGNLIDYASMNSDEQTAPGQVTFSEFMDIYNYPSLNSETAIYGLIGNPVTHSPGHIYHNHVFQTRNLNAVYVKMQVEGDELAEFIALAKAIGIQGLSVTIPLKEKILPFVDEIEADVKYMGAVNTLLLKGAHIVGTNTDGSGALDAIEKKSSVDGKKIVILGAGGAARAIACEAHHRGALVWILNRTVEKAIELAALLEGSAGGLKDVPVDYDIIVNCSPDPMPIDIEKILPNTLAMDVVYAPRDTAFLKAAALKECCLVYGEEMFVAQAAGQSKFWVDA